MAKKILLADDSITIQKVIELTFSDEDFDVVTVGNGRLALEKLSDVRPDIVLCDIIMPEKDGYEVCQFVKNSPDFGHVPVLLLTGAFEPFDQEKAAQVGSDGFLAKPFEPETLIAKVKDLLGRGGGGKAEGTAPHAPIESTPVAASGVTEEAPLVTEAAPPVGLADDPATATTVPQPVISRPVAEEPPASPSFISDEPFPTAEPPTAEPPPPAVTPAAVMPADDPLAPVTPEESATLAGEPPSKDAGEADAASTVMFAANDLPWSGQAGASAPAEPPSPPVVEAFEPMDEPTPVVEVTATPDLADEAGAAFEEVLEEDLEFAKGGVGAQTPASATMEPQEPAVFSEADIPVVETAAPEPPPTFEAASPSTPVGERTLEPEPFTQDAPPTFEVATPAAPQGEQVFEPEPSSETPPTFEVAGSPAPEVEPMLAPEPPAPEPPVAETPSPAPPAPESPALEPPPTFEVAAPEPVVTEPPLPPPAPLETVPPLEPEQPPVPGPPPVFEVGEPPAPAGEQMLEPDPVPEPTPVFEVAAPATPQPETMAPLESETAAPEAPAPQLAPLAGPEPEPPVAPEPEPAAPPASPSFADVEPAVEPAADAEAGAVSPSEAASVPVPVEQVEKIAQRVVAQVSEKIVREIAWEVIPDLAEALIKQEIERLKAELQKL